MSDILPGGGVSHDIELVIKVRGGSDASHGDLTQLAACADNIKKMVEAILAAEFGQPPVLVSTVIRLTAGKRPRKSTCPPSLGSGPTKKDLILDLLRKTEGATLPDLQAATGWRQNTVSGQLTYLSKLGYDIARVRVGPELRYRLVE
jgi:hypothetical protein